MSLFSIHCTTCHAKLSVRTAEAIGQIVACPKCHSMVEVVPPPDWEEPVSPAEPTASEPASAPAEETQAEAPPDAPPTPAAAWASPAELLGRQILLRGAAIGGGLLVVGALVGYWIMRPGPEPLLVAEQPIESPLEQEFAEPEVAPPPKRAADVDAEPVAHDPPSEEPEASNPPTSPEAPPDVPPSDAVSPEQEAIGEERPPAERAVDTETVPPEPVAEPPAPAEAEPPAEPTDPSASPVAPQSSLLAPQESPAVRRFPLPTTFAPPDVEARLADRIRQIEVRAAPLVRLLAMLTEMTTLPITLDLDALAAAGIAPTRSISAVRQNASIAEILEGTLTDAGLTYAVEKGQVVVTTRAWSKPDRVRFTYPVGDLAGDEPEDAERFGQLLRGMVAPDAWKATGGDGTMEPGGGKLAIEQTRPIHDALVDFCERLRVARGLPTRSRYPRARFRLTSPRAMAAPLLDRPAKFTFHEATRLGEVARSLETLTGATIVVDWRSLAEADFGPQSEIAAAVDEPSLAEALSALLEPLDLAWRAVDARTIEILSRHDAARKLECEFYPVAAILDRGVKPDRLQAAVVQGTAPKLWSERGGPGVLYFDAPSKQLIVRQTQAVQADVAGILASLTQPSGDGSQ